MSVTIFKSLYNSWLFLILKFLCGLQISSELLFPTHSILYHFYSKCMVLYIFYCIFFNVIYTIPQNYSSLHIQCYDITSLQSACFTSTSYHWFYHCFKYIFILLFLMWSTHLLKIILSYRFNLISLFFLVHAFSPTICFNMVLYNFILVPLLTTLNLNLTTVASIACSNETLTN